MMMDMATFLGSSNNKDYFPIFSDGIHPQSFILNSNAENPDIDGQFWLNWTISLNAINYSLYYSNKPIYKLNESVALIVNGLTNLSYSIDLLENGTYYFIVQAYSENNNSLFSNLINITISIYSPSDNDDNIDDDDDDKSSGLDYWVIWLWMGFGTCCLISLVGFLTYSYKKGNLKLERMNLKK